MPIMPIMPIMPQNPSPLDFPFSIAPMVGITHRFFRRLAREISRRTVLYTPMVHCQALIRHSESRSQALANAIDFSDSERPLIIQLAGHQPETLARATVIANKMGYDGINLNLGCPASSAESGSFGACLMRDPEQVADCVAAMKENSSISVSVKHRLGLDLLELDPPAFQKLKHFIERVSANGCHHFIVHARTALLAQKIDPKKNRNIPPLNYAAIIQLAKEYPHLRIELNGGIATIDEARPYLAQVDGIMIGRAAVKNPLLFFGVDSFGSFASKEQGADEGSAAKPDPDRRQIWLRYLDFLASDAQIPHQISTSDCPQNWQPTSLTEQDALAKKLRSWKIALRQSELQLQKAFSPLQSLYAGQPGNKKFQQLLSQMY